MYSPQEVFYPEKDNNNLLKFKHLTESNLQNTDFLLQQTPTVAL